MVGYDYKSPIVSFHINDPVDSDPFCDYVHDEQEFLEPAAVEENIAEE